MKSPEFVAKRKGEKELERSCQRVCVTPTKNESWIIKSFLGAALYWADHVIVADQGSTDGTLQQLQNTPGVEAVINDSPVYDESSGVRSC